MTKRILSIIISIVLILSSIPLSVSAFTSTIASTNDDEHITSFTKTASWTDEPIKENATIELTSKLKNETSSLKILFLGSLCDAHSLSTTTMKNTINSCLKLADVDYYFYSTDSELNTMYKSGSTWMKNGNYQKSTYNGQLKKGSTFDLQFDTSTAFTHPRHACLYNVAYRISQTDLDQYDMIVLETDAARMGLYTANPSKAMNNALLSAAKKMKDAYAKNKVVWIIPQKNFLIEDCDLTKNYKAKYIFNEYYLTHPTTSSGKDTESSQNGYFYSEQTYESMAILDPEDWLNAAGTAKGTVPVFNAKDPKKNQFNEKIFNSKAEGGFLPNIPIRTAGNEDNPDPSTQIWVTYENSSKVEKFVEAKIDSFLHDKVVITDTVNDGFTIKENGVTGYKFDKASGDYVKITDNSFTYTINGQKVTGTFDTNALENRNVKMNIEITTNSDDTDPFKTNTVVQTNKGNATAICYEVKKPVSDPVEYYEVDNQEAASPTLEKLHYQITTEVTNGTIDPNTIVYEGNDCTINYSPNEHYHIESITVDGTSLSDDDVLINKDKYEFTNINENHDIKVVYEIDKYNVNFNTNGGTPTPESQTVLYNEKVTSVSDPKKEGYTFIGWFDESLTNEWDFENDTVKSDMTLFATYKEDITKLHYDANGGENAPEDQDMLYSEAEYISSNQPTRDGYEFCGWADTIEKANAGTIDYLPEALYKDEKVLKPDATLYAVWTEEKVTLKYEAEVGGAVTNSEDIVDKFTGEPNGSTAEANEGYHFVRWKDSQGTTVSEDPQLIPTMPEGGFVPETYTAVFEKDTVVVDYNMHGHGENPGEEILDKGAYATKPDEPSEKGYTFLGWFTDDTYENEFDFANTQILENTTIHAKWAEKKATLKYDANGGINAPKDQELLYSQEADISSTIPTKDNYIFKGWSEVKDGEVKYSPEDIYKEANIEPHDDILYAVWEEEIIPIYYVADENGTVNNDEDNVNPIKGDPNGSTATPNEGYHFVNWTNSNGLEVSKELYYKPEKDKTDNKYKTDTYTAHFEINEYTVQFDTLGHGDNPDDQTVKHNEKVDTPTTPSDDGFTFEGWYKDTQFKEVWDFENDTVTSDITLYGKWSENNVPLHYDANGGINAPKDQVMTYSKETDIAKEEPTWEGHEFSGWATSKENADKGIVSYKPEDIYKNANVAPVETTLYACWNESKVEINYTALEGGSVDNNSDIVDAVTGNPQGSTATPDKGYKFVKWIDDDKKEVSTDKYYKPTKDETTGLFEPATYTAVFEKIDYIVDFDIHGHGVQPENQIKNYQDLVDDPGDLEEEGYVFKGWYKDPLYKEEWLFDEEKIEGNTTIHAKWEEITATLKYDANGGINPPVDQILTYTQEAKVSNTVPTRPGFTFKGWSTEKDGEVVYNPNSKYKDAKVVPVDAILYAVWEENELPIYYKADKGGKVSNDKDVVKEESGKPNGSTATPDEGYHFTNWTNSKDEIVSDMTTYIPGPDAQTGLYKTDTYTAHFEINEYTVKFDTLGHDDNPNDQNKKYNEKVDKVTDPKDDGFVFEGWYQDKEYKDKWDFDNDKVTSDITLYAKWSENNVPLHYDANGGTNAPKDQIMTYSKETDVAKDEPIWAGHEFFGWATSKENADKGIVSYKPDDLYKNANVVPVEATLYACWKESKIEINYTALEGGSVDNTSDVISAVTGEPKGSTATPDKGYKFVKWIDKDKKEVSKDNLYIPTKDETTGLFEPATYTAVFEKIDYTVNFENNGHGEKPDNQTHNYGDKVNNPGDLNENGYIFKGWYKDAKLEEPWNFEEDTIVGNTTIYAKWEEVTATLHYDPNGGKNEPKDQTMTYTEPCNISKETPTRENYIFKGWSDTKDGEVKYVGDDIYKEGNIVPKDSIVYAVWEEVKIPIYYEAEPGGTVSNAQDTVEKFSGTPNGSVGIPDEGYHFLRWYDENKQEVSTNENFVPTMPEGGYVTTTYTAAFEINKYTITFDMNDHGEQVNDQIIEYGKTPIVPNTPTDKGYTFESWYKDKDCTIPYDFEEPITENKTIYAKWTEDEVLLHYDANGGKNAPQDQIMIYSEAAIISNQEPVREGYTFYGWATTKENADSGIVEYTKDSIYRDKNIVKEEATLYACWDENKVTIHYVANEGGNVTPTEETIDVITGNPQGSIATPNEFYEFVCWVDEGGNIVSENLDFIPTKNPDTNQFEAATYIAKFKPVTHIVNFDTNGKGETPETQVVIHNDLVEKPKDPTCEGYALYAWYKDKDHKEIWNFKTDKVEEDTTLYAYWSKIIVDPTNPIKPANDITVKPPKDEYYTGTEIKVTDIEIYYNGTLLALGKDYKIVGYETNVEVGKAYVIVEGNGPDFVGTLKIPFNILPVSSTNNQTIEVQNPAAVKTGSTHGAIILLLVMTTLLGVLLLAKANKNRYTPKHIKH